VNAAPAPTGESLPPRARLRRKRDFQRVFQGGWRGGTRELRLVIRPNDLGYPRLGLAVGRKVGNAVVRNRMKRRLREVFRRERALLAAPVDVVVIPQPGAAALSFEALREQLLRGMKAWRPRGRGPRENEPRRPAPQRADP